MPNGRRRISGRAATPCTYWLIYGMGDSACYFHVHSILTHRDVHFELYSASQLRLSKNGLIQD